MERIKTKSTDQTRNTAALIRTRDYFYDKLQLRLNGLLVE